MSLILCASSRTIRDSRGGKRSQNKNNNKQHQYRNSPFQEERSRLNWLAPLNMESILVTSPTDQRRVTEIRGEMGTMIETTESHVDDTTRLKQGDTRQSRQQQAASA
jgi:hypothetical protein